MRVMLVFVMLLALCGNASAAAAADPPEPPRITLWIEIKPPGDSGVRLNYHATKPGEHVHLQFTIGSETGKVEGDDEVEGFVSVPYLHNSGYSINAEAWTDEHPDKRSTGSAGRHTSQIGSAFGADPRTRIAVWRPEDGTWYVWPEPDVPFSTQWGMAGDMPAPADFDGDANGDREIRTDVAVWRPGDGAWWIRGSEYGDELVVPRGRPGDIPVPGDYLSAGVADAAVWRPGTGEWMIWDQVWRWGLPTDIPVPGDYDGDGLDDLAVWRKSTGDWWIRGTRRGEYVVQFGAAGDMPVPADYDADGRFDQAIWRPESGQWWINASTAGVRVFPYGAPQDIPVPGDYDGDAKADIAVVRREAQQLRWFIEFSGGGRWDVSFGLPTDIPVQAHVTLRTWNPPG